MIHQRFGFGKETVLLAVCLAAGMPCSLGAVEIAAADPGTVTISLPAGAGETQVLPESSFPEEATEDAGEKRLEQGTETVLEYGPEAETETETETETEEFDEPYEQLTVGTPTPLEGNFFTEMWGNAVSDLDVRSLLHGYNLVQWSNTDGTFVFDPSVVSGVMVTENQEGDHTYTLVLYSDLRYSDGTPVTAADYAFSMLLTMAPETAAIGADVRIPEYLEGYREYADGKSSVLSGVRMPDAHTLSITIRHEYLPFFYEVGLLDCNPCPIGEIAPGCVVVDNGDGIAIVNEDEKIREPLFTAELLKETLLDEETGYCAHPAVTSGPYRLLSYDGKCAEFEINPYYKGNSEGILPQISRIRFTSADNDDMVADLEEDTFDLLNKCVDAEAVAEGISLITRHGRQFAMGNYARSGLTFISFCCEQNTVQSCAVRQAIAFCLDKEHLVKDYVGNYGLTVDGYYGMGQWMVQVLNGTLKYPVAVPEDETDTQAVQDYEAALEAWEELDLEEVKRYSLDLQEAVRLLEEDGWVLNEDGEPFDPEEDRVRYKWIPREEAMSEIPAGITEDETQAPEEAEEDTETAAWTEPEEDTETAAWMEPEEDEPESETEPEDAASVEELVGLELTLLYPEGNRIGESLEEYFAENLEQVGIAVNLEQVPMQELLSQYYREEGERDCDMIYLGTNFDLLFDPSLTFRPEEETEESLMHASDDEAPEESVSEEETTEENTSEAEAPTEGVSETEVPEENSSAVESVSEEESISEEEETEDSLPDEEEAGERIPSRRVYQTTGYAGEELYELALELRHTRPGDALEYCRKWIAFQEEFAREVPMIPIYSNVYFDFYDRSLQNYRITDHVTWGEAIVGSRLGDPAEEETEELTEELTEEELQEGEILIDD